MTVGLSSSLFRTLSVIRSSEYKIVKECVRLGDVFCICFQREVKIGEEKTESEKTLICGTYLTKLAA